ncbi:hypothetical protein A5CPYCFAH4_17620 [Alistipes onderdonkii subsp. vulgaris]|uniref:Uncharacterized protein n=1 Tax=Alistipes onderdonkii subsp. vulgaris TaxID=2585117 RepID=A0ACA8QXL5_9BACT|nr:hypothetical protein A5CPYCFAH4_17620 [Alistipes onderdonkii subsp. vulgaris]BBL12332.1 hypothetical protein A5NYCFA2_17650 [Alistipes onderdonkii subsp. vulgaris]
MLLPDDPEGRVSGQDGWENSSWKAIGEKLFRGGAIERHDTGESDSEVSGEVSGKGDSRGRLRG